MCYDFDYGFNLVIKVFNWLLWFYMSHFGSSSWSLLNFRHRDLSFAPGEVRFVDTNDIPTYKQPASAVYKCLNPPNCN